MKVMVEVKVIQIQKGENNLSGREWEKELFNVDIFGDSTKEVEEKVALLQQALTHMGWKLK